MDFHACLLCVHTYFIVILTVYDKNALYREAFGLTLHISKVSFYSLLALLPQSAPWQLIRRFIANIKCNALIISK